MKKSTGEKLKLGLFVSIGLLIFIVAVYFIGQRQNLFVKTFTISSNFTNVNGLIPGNNVRYSGINVGTVKQIQMLNDTVINVQMVLEEKMINHIKKDAIATIGTDGLVGNMIVNIIPGEQGTSPIEEGDVIKSFTKIGTNEMLNTLNTTNENAALLTSKLLNIANEITDGKGTLGMLITDTIMSKNLIETVNYLKLTSMEANKTIKELNGLIKQVDLENSLAGVVLNDTVSARQLRHTVTNLENSSKDIQTVLSNLNTTIEQIKDGEGALNYLSTNEELVEQLKDIINNINEGTDKFNENMEALKHNFLTRSYFRKLEREEKKKEQ
ncbi:MCE family protein [Paucihalobacter ruber]|uniref:MCE family protein n=1 Tax=Paucihalobacter ruber TaxID=2567861 RepID=A0A506PNV5_9FLAO|nr:MlaD family protein [Paucihalobacter ruber]TPV35596.1 MCE family protein [Paucihalobacter ruber]